jgi:hypothetical protein
MKNKLKILSIIMAMFLLGYVAGIADETNMSGLWKILGLVVSPAVLLFFLKKEIISVWWYFSLVFLLISIFLIFGGNGGGVLGGKVVITYLLSWLYFFLSLGLIVFKSISLRGK